MRRVFAMLGHFQFYWLLLTNLENITPTIIITPLTLSPFCLLLLVRLGGYIVNLCDFYSYRLIGKLTVILQLQEFILRNMTVSSFTTSTRLPHVCHKCGCRQHPYQDVSFTYNSKYRRLSYSFTNTHWQHHTDPHSQTSGLLTSSLSLGVPVPHPMYVRRVDLSSLSFVFHHTDTHIQVFSLALVKRCCLFWINKRLLKLGCLFAAE